MAYLAGDTLTEHITLINPDGTPILGATFPSEDPTVKSIWLDTTP